MGTEKRESAAGFIAPICEHGKDKPAPQLGWIITCSEDYVAAVRLNLLKYVDAIQAVRLEEELRAARATIQKQAADIEDMKLSRRTAFVRCACGRIKELNLDCRGCGS